MLKKIALTILGICLCAVSPAAEVLLAPVDPLAWAVANTDWGPFGGAQLKKLREVVNGQVIAHEANASYTDPETRIVKRLKCFDPANCVMCSPAAMEYGRKMRGQLSATSVADQANAANLAALATYYDQQVKAAKDRERLNAEKGDYIVTTTRMEDGREVTTTSTVTFQNPGNAGAQRAQQLATQMRQSAQMQSQQQGGSIYAYITAALETLQKPQPAIELNVGRDPLAGSSK